MTLNPCIVIPCYNHGYALSAILEDLARFNLPILIVNDGSDDETTRELERLQSSYAQVSALHRSRNGGKGVAVVDGMLWALERGYSHAILLDSDGQHATDDIPLFMQAAQLLPERMILGAPKFGDDAPLARLLGREISNIFVAMVTAKLAARDVLCGFRMYPLAVLNERIDLRKLQPRMGFDAEIVVRALWSGIPIHNVPTKVIYPEGGTSHFRYGTDNLQLAHLYVKLSVEALYRVPRRWLSASSGKGVAQPWFQMSERGSLRGLRLLLLVLEKIGKVPLLLLLPPIVAHMFVWGGAARRSAVEFQKVVSDRRGERPSRVALYGRAARQFWEFGLSIVEKVVSWREGIPLEKFTWVGRDEVKAELAQGRGAIFMGAHVGNIEVIRALGESRQVVVNALMYTANSRHFRAILEEVNANSSLRVIDLSTLDPSVVFDLQERLDRGEIVALLADRAPKNSVGRVVEVPFLGRSAKFPEGPWILSSLFNAPVYTVFSMRERGGRYHVEFKRLADRISLPRANRVAALKGYMEEFSHRLGEVALRYRYQWFNFFSFWSESAPEVSTIPHSTEQVVAPESV